jgi:hypothetical protein
MANEQKFNITLINSVNSVTEVKTLKRITKSRTAYFVLFLFYPFDENRLPNMRIFPSMLSTSQFYLYNYHWFHPINKICSRRPQLM